MECANCHTDLGPLRFVRGLPQSYLARARAQASAGAAREALADAALAVALEPALVEAQALLAELQEATGEEAQARSSWQKVLEMSAQHPEGARWRARGRRLAWRAWGRRALWLLAPLLVLGLFWLREVRAHQQQVSALAGELEESRTESAQRGQELDQVRQQIETLAAEFKTLADQFQGYQASHRFPNRRVHQLERRKGELEQQVSSLTVQLAGYGRLYELRAEEVEQLRQEKQALADEFERYRASHRHPDGSVEQLRQRIRELEEENAALRKKTPAPPPLS
ncbi:MAG: hypothetical protein ACE5MH_03580 [Terriglobia bacterium]